MPLQAANDGFHKPLTRPNDSESQRQAYRCGERVDTVVGSEQVGGTGENIFLGVAGAIYTKAGHIHHTHIHAQLWGGVEGETCGRLDFGHARSFGIVKLLVAGREVDHQAGAYIEALRCLPLQIGRAHV